MVLVYCNSVDIEYQRNSKVLFTFVPDRAFGQLITDSPQNIFKNI